MINTNDLCQQRELSRYWLALKLVPRLSVQKKLDLVSRYGLKRLFTDDSLIANLNLTKGQHQGFLKPDWQRVEGIIEQTLAAHASIITFDDPKYPLLLKEIYDPPLVLFVKGNSDNLTKNQIALVGSRNASIQGRETAQRFAQELAEHGAVITSGLALGIDAAAHKGALHVSAPTIAVVATGIDKIYPSRHRNLQQQILATHGTIVSEFLPGTPPKTGHFPKRNRIISGMSYGVVVVEAEIKSGSLITARSALDQNREVFAIPGSIYHQNALGCHWLIKQGAKLVDQIADIKEEIGFLQENSLNLSRNKEKDKESKKSCNQDLCNDSLLASVGYEITPVDIVVSRSKLPTDVVLTRLTMLELRGLVSAVPGGYLKIK
ncbi:DNA-processing protein DprA [Thalassotalea profundi]|uniref:DNA processing protein DprA n=1 Tax=Thalassotalea profundi TaxID=2036687 RepID=A0ABQ3IZ49_9GAMM|nr:DNA-processing protein DprA [Thalassotalea profundi]GHE96418.1 DNA processing protein DprA [Thalassotalea profundi]